MSQFPLGSHVPHLVCRFLRHIGTFVDHLGGVGTPMSWVLVSIIQAKLSKYMGRGRSISQLLLGPHAPNTFLEVPETHRSISRSLGRCWHTCWQSASPQNWAKLSKNISFYEVQCTKYFLEVLETHRNISRLLDRCWHTCRQSVCAQKQGQVEQIHGGVGRSIFQLLLKSLAPHLFGRFLRHIETFVYDLGGVDTPMSWVLVSIIQAKLRKYMASREVNISASIRAPCTKYFFGSSLDT